jgi:homogentisate 1,2-dioxygenase
VRISFAAGDAASELYRNSAGDEAIYISAGSALFESVYGSLPAGPGIMSWCRAARFTAGFPARMA